LKFLHAADIHLDSPLSGLGFYEDASADILRTATREAFSNLVNEAIEENVDFLVIAGDLYDGNWKDYNTGYYFCREMGKLNKVGIPVYLLFGNHDAENEMSKKLLLPPNVHQFETRKPTTFRIEEIKVALHGRSFKEAATTENLAVNYPDPVPGWFNIGVLHTALEGNAMHATYAPCSLAELNAKKYDYWALGHVHEHAILKTDPWIVFSGNIQGRNIRETGPHGVVLVTADETQILSVERVFVDVLRWSHVKVDASEVNTLTEVAQLVGREFEHIVSANTEGKHMSARITISGKTNAHGELFGMESQLRAEILGQAAAIGNNKLWIEKVRVETLPKTKVEDIKSRSDAIADLQALLEEAPNDESLLQNLSEQLKQLVGKAPIELQESVPDFKIVRNNNIEEIVKSVSPGLIAYLAKMS